MFGPVVGAELDPNFPLAPSEAARLIGLDRRELGKKCRAIEPEVRSPDEIYQLEIKGFKFEYRFLSNGHRAFRLI